MANTYTLISSNVLASTATTFTFSSIPQTYTDLVLRCSVRVSNAITNGVIYIAPNGDASSLYTQIRLVGDGSVASSSLETSRTNNPLYGTSEGSSFTATTFASSETYIPNYALTNTKPFSTFGVTENNGTSAQIAATASLYRGTSAITSLDISSTQTMIVGSSFYLYGIKNS